MRGNRSFEDLLDVLQEWDGYFVFHHEGEEFVIGRKEELERVSSEESEIQLELPSAEQSLAEGDADVLERINRDIALFQEQFIDDDIVDEDIPSNDEATKVRFEPLRGDLAPDLQE